MKLIDKLELRVCSGKGGDGIVSWLHLKYIPKGGPAGGDGGKGGDVYLEAVKDIEALRRYAGVKELHAQDGKPGQSKNKKGLNGEDLTIYLPVGSVIKFDGKTIDLQEVGERVKILNGGRGGFGNTHFKSSTNIRPQESTPGQAARCANLHIELQIIADMGLLGMPNAGKSSLLNTLSNSKSKVGDYPFTTVEPKLGVFDGIVLADIPGLVKGAAEGKGLGIKFLKHLRRTRILLHLVSVESDDPCKTYSAIRDELASFDRDLLDKQEIVLLSKSDLAQQSDINKKLKDLEFCSKKKVYDLSLNKTDTINSLKELIKNRFTPK